MGTVYAVQSSRTRHTRWLAPAVLLLAGIAWFAVAIWQRPTHVAIPLPAHVPELSSGMVAATDSPLFSYSPGWEVSPLGADPPQPQDPLAEPAGVVEFSYHGNELALSLATGNYWGYLYATVDGRPANLLPALAGNEYGDGHAAGYKTLYEPEREQDGQNSVRWLRVHRAGSAGDGTAHRVRLEFWRGWGQTPLAAAGVDVLPPEPLPLWPGVLLGIAALWGFGAGFWQLQPRPSLLAMTKHLARAPARWRMPLWAEQAARGMAVVGMAGVIGGVTLETWFLCAAGVALLALAGVVRPAFWMAALLFGLPFYYGVKLPLLPGRPVSLIDLGVLGGAAILMLHWALQRVTTVRMGASHPGGTSSVRRTGKVDFSGQFNPFHASRPASFVLLMLALIASWALVSVAGARYVDFALREWRTVFANGLLFALILAATLQLSRRPRADGWLMVTAWLAGGAVVSLFGLWGYWSGGDLVSQAEGVRRVQAFYDSPNNLALYLDRTVPVALALALFLPGRRQRLVWALLVAPQVLVLLLTFSKGSLLLAVPAMAAVLGIGGAWLLRREQRSVWPLVGLAAALILGGVLLTPFLGAERFQRLFDAGTGTGFLRLQLWRSAWQMAQDFPLLGVGPDNFLYHYRSDYILPPAWQEPDLNHPHNLFLDWWTRLGVPGLVLGLAWLSAGVWVIFRRLRGGSESALMLGLLAATAAALAHGLIDVSYALPDLMLVWVLVFTLATEFGREGNSTTEALYEIEL